MAVKTLKVRGGLRNQDVIGESTGTPIVHSMYLSEGSDLESHPDQTTMVNDEPSDEQY